MINLNLLVYAKSAELMLAVVFVVSCYLVCMDKHPVLADSLQRLGGSYLVAVLLLDFPFEVSPFSS